MAASSVCNFSGTNVTDYTFTKPLRCRLLVTCACSILNGGNCVRHTDPMGASFDELIEEAEAVSVDGWDFSWLEGRATEERPPWGYARLLGQKLAGVEASLDIQTGGGEVLAQAPVIPRLAVATESFLPNVVKATALLHPRGIAVVKDADEPPLPFADGAFDLVTSRHPATIWWDEIARVLRPGGTYFAQHVGPGSAFELIEYFLGPQPRRGLGRRPDYETTAARKAGLDIVDLREARLRIEIHDVSAVVYLLRKVVWWVPGFTVAAYRDRLLDLHHLIQREGPFIAHSTRHLIEARRRA
jgi:SAM-dependent methyltransferase